MDSSFREDILEALYTAAAAGSPAPVLEDLAALLTEEEAALMPALHQLENDGNIVIHPDGTLALTAQGEETGGKISRKHRILECFFSEMLGMEPETASVEACTLEHEVSDEAIDRLGRYLKFPGCTGPRGMRRGRRWHGRSLLESTEGDTLTVSAVKCGMPSSRLGDLGIVPGEEIRLIHHIPENGVVIRVKGCDIALSREIAASILVQKRL